MFLMNQMAIALFRFLAAVARNFDVANSYGSLALIALLVMSGFVMARSECDDGLLAEIDTTATINIT